MMNRKRLSAIETFSIVALSVTTTAVITKLVGLVLSVTPNILRFVGLGLAMLIAALTRRRELPYKTGDESYKDIHLPDRSIH
ncbi:MAG TPA: hypothetical protein VFV58_28690 [Blastocatellia bacterium]|nr:hypothetical protein [Blastocatellia bacterium]